MILKTDQEFKESSNVLKTFQSKSRKSWRERANFLINGSESVLFATKDILLFLLYHTI